MIKNNVKKVKKSYINNDYILDMSVDSRQIFDYTFAGHLAVLPI